MSESEIRSRPTVAALWIAMRPKQWAKNVFVFAALVFADRLSDPHSLFLAIGAFACFCAISSATYLFNDVADREADRLHPVKKARPVAAGELTPALALVAAAVLAAGGLAGSWALAPALAWVTALYVLQNLLYSAALKRVVILDVMMVAAGFLLRAWAGAAVLDVAVSEWLVLCTGLLALFLGFVKRRQELAALRGTTAQRPILREYTLPFLDQMISVVTAATVVCYALYAFSSEVAAKLHTRHLGATLPFVVFGIFRYLYLVHVRGEGENPTQLVVSDVPLLLNVVLWSATVLLAVYVWR